MTNRRRDAEADLDDLVELAKGLAHPTRLRLLAMLAGGELCVCQMTAILELAPSTVSQHLSVLDRGRLVAERKEGKLVFYRLRDTWYVVSVDPRTGETGKPTKVIAGSFVNILGYSYDVARDGRLLVIVGPPEETASHIRVIGNFGAELRRAQSRR